MRVLGLVLAGVLALITPIAAQAGPLGSHMRPAGAGSAPGIVKVWDGNHPGWHPAPNGGGGGWHQAPGPGHSHPWSGGWVPRQWGPNGPPGGWAPGVPTYWVWGPSGGAFDYPFADWRGPTGGWGNP
jgi:hypothetical protein